MVIIEMADGSVIKLELDETAAPITAANFKKLVSEGFYDGLTFHRIIPGFMIQGGDPTGTGMGGPGYSIRGEFKGNGFDNNLKHDKGVLSMARSMHPDSAGSQFFLMVERAPHLDGQYAAFGKVIEGIEACEEIVSVRRNGQDKPFEDQVMEKLTVEGADDMAEPEVKR